MLRFGDVWFDPGFRDVRCWIVDFVFSLVFAFGIPPS